MTHFADSVYCVGIVVEKVSTEPDRKFCFHYTKSELILTLNYTWEVEASWNAGKGTRLCLHKVLVNLQYRQVLDFAHRSSGYQSKEAIPAVQNQNLDDVSAVTKRWLPDPQPYSICIALVAVSSPLNQPVVQRKWKHLNAFPDLLRLR